MKVPIWVHETAALFWDAAGVPEPFPRTFREPICRSPFELAVKELPGLSTTVAEKYLSRLGPGWVCGGTDRAVRACLAARDGAGLILLDAADAPAERTFSLAHELAHFLWHYWRRRQWAGSQLGYRAIEVFDGRRKPTPAERLRALLSNVPLGPHVHLMERGPRREIVDDRVAIIEEEADRLAYELLAPADAVWTRSKGVLESGNNPNALAAMLVEEFGMPVGRAEDYCLHLLPPSTPNPLIRRIRR